MDDRGIYIWELKQFVSEKTNICEQWMNKKAAQKHNSADFSLALTGFRMWFGKG